MSDVSNLSNPQVERLRQFQEAAWQLSTQHIKWPGIKLNEALGPWDEGIAVITALENIGKSTFSVATVAKVLATNDDVCVLDGSLDDSFRERTRRYVSCIAGVDTPKIARPVLCSEHELKRRDYAYNKVASWMKDSRLEIRTAAEDGFSQHFNITKAIHDFRDKNPDKKLLVLLDALHDILLPDTKSDEAEKHVLQEISNALKETGAICLMTAHRRKSSRSEFTRVVHTDEIKGSATIKYQAKMILSLHNEVKVRRKDAEVFWCSEEEPEKKMPVLEISVQKNKSSEWDGWIFYEFHPSIGRIQEATPEDAEYWENIARESMRPKRTF